MKNLVPLPYRRVSVQRYDGEMTESGIRAHLLGREAYRRTDYVVLRRDQATAVVSVNTPDRESLFSPINSVELLSLPESTVFADDPDTDTGIPSALASKAHDIGVGPEGTLVVQGKYAHVNFIHHPDPLVIRIVDVAPPDPVKLFDLAQRVLNYVDDLPPIHFELERIDLNDLAAGHRPDAFLVPCRSGGLDRFSAPIFFLDERPESRQDWLLIGCERSLQFHRHYYGDEPPRVEMCPRKLVTENDSPTLIKCCLLEFDTEIDNHIVVTPWGSDLKMVEKAIRQLVSTVVPVND